MYETPSRCTPPGGQEPEGPSVFPGDAPHLSWDEELATLLRESAPSGPWATPAPTRGAPSEPYSDPYPEDRPPAEPERNTAELPPVRHPTPSHRRVRPPRKPFISLLRTVSILIAALTAVIVSMVSVYGGMVAYAPLLRNATQPGASAGVVRWWPLLVYGPWLVASLSILRAAFHRRRATHSWCAVLLFSSLAVLLCVAQAPRTPLGATAAALPAVAALACFQQLVRQITLTRPPRQAAPRHRNAAPPPRRPTPPGPPG
ncbi:DUF2637 domain-containing protein [Streptomyces sp. NPDC015131]|uniref:DUF2637 domain-containing protein n=1 Tax=Streptomyces sp. NPDC015131 TaxID=3364941 RepID=UPI0036FBBC88